MEGAGNYAGSGGVYHGAPVMSLRLCVSARSQKIRLCVIPYDVMHKKELIWNLTCWACFFDNPIQLWTVGMKYVSASIIARLPTLWKAVGIIITFLFLNILAFIYLRVEDGIIRIWKVCK